MDWIHGEGLKAGSGFHWSNQLSSFLSFSNAQKGHNPPTPQRTPSSNWIFVQRKRGDFLVRVPGCVRDILGMENRGSSPFSVPLCIHWPKIVTDVADHRDHWLIAMLSLLVHR